MENQPTNPINPDLDISKLSREEQIDLLRLIDHKEKIGQEKLRNFVPSVIQRAALCSTSKITIVVGGNQSGKSECGGVRTVICATGVVPKSMEGDFPQQLIRPGAYWCSALDYGGARDILSKKLDLIIPDKMVKNYSKEDKIYTLSNASEIGLKSEESQRKKYQGVQRLGVWMDEEHTKPVYDEIFERTTTLQGFIFFTFSPIEGLTWSYSELYKRASKIYFTKNTAGISEEVGQVHTLEEIALLKKERKLYVQENVGSEFDPNVAVYIISKYDNQFLPDQEIQNSERKYIGDPAQYQARVLGRYSRLSNRNVFDVESLMKMQSRAATTYKRGEIVNGQFKESSRGRLVIFSKEIKKANGCYVIGADSAEGLEEGDYSCAQILDRRTCEQVAIWHGHCAPEEFGRILYDLGMFYNKAYLAPERNFHGYGIVNFLREKKYLRLYYDRDKGQEAIRRQGQGHKTYGWETNARTKPIMIQTLAGFIRDKHLKLNDIHTIDELQTYVYDKDGATGSMGGCYDDRVMALAIAIQLYESTPITVLSGNDDVHHGDTRVNKQMGY